MTKFDWSLIKDFKSMQYYATKVERIGKGPNGVVFNFFYIYFIRNIIMALLFKVYKYYVLD